MADHVRLRGDLLPKPVSEILDVLVDLSQLSERLGEFGISSRELTSDEVNVIRLYTIELKAYAAAVREQLSDAEMRALLDQNFEEVLATAQVALEEVVK